MSLAYWRDLETGGVVGEGYRAGRISERHVKSKSLVELEHAIWRE